MTTEFELASDPNADTVERSRALDEMVLAGDQRARALCESWANSPSDVLQMTALEHLLGVYGSEVHARLVMTILENSKDLDWYLSTGLCQALGRFAFKFGKNQAAIVETLSQVIRECEEPGGRSEAYHSILMLLDNTWLPKAPEEASAETVDWGRINEFIRTRG